MLPSLMLVLMLTVGALPGEESFLAGDAAERAGNFQKALESYSQSAEKDAALKPYSELRIARCRARLKGREAAKSAYRAFLEAHQEGPWVRMAEMALAELLQEDKRYAEAAPLYTRALDVTPQPWWMGRLAWEAAENLFADENLRPSAFGWYRNRVETAIYASDRLDAARRLAVSPDLEDRAIAVLGMLRSGAYQEAGKAMLGVDVPLESGEGQRLPLRNLIALILHSGSGKKGANPDLAGTASANGDNIWVRPLLLYALRLQASRKRYEDAEKICALLATRYPKLTDGADNLWWLANYLEEHEKADKALALYLELAEKYPKHFRADDALLQAAALTDKSGKVEDARKTLLALVKEYPESPLRAQAYYRIAKQYSTAKDSQKASIFFALAGEAGMGDYFAHRALGRIADPKKAAEAGVEVLDIGGGAVLGTQKSAALPARYLDKTPPDDIRLTRLFFFGSHGLEEGEWEALDIARGLGAMQDPAPYYHALAEAGFVHSASEFARAAAWGVEKHEEAPNGERLSPARLRLEYPRAYWPHVLEIAKETKIDPYLLLAVARQESTFRASVVSRSGATGIMQVMPATAQWLAKVDSNVSAAHAGHLASPINSLRTGAYYLMRMLARSDGNLVYALASYNAGPGNCTKWKKRFPGYKMDEFIEAIPFSETRQYVKKVLGNYAAYHSIYGPAPMPPATERPAKKADAKAAPASK